MPIDQLGIVAGLQAKREAVVSRLSPAAKHAAFPTVYARPAPHLSEAQKLRRELHRVQGALDETKAENLRLQTMVKELHAELEKHRRPGDIIERIPRSATIANVQKQFLVEYNELSVIDGREPLTLPDLIGPRRGWGLAHPRQVCMWLCSKLCKENSLPRIGRAFGGKDHTTVMHAKRVAPDRMQSRPDLNLVAFRVIAHFEAKQ